MRFINVGNRMVEGAYWYELPGGAINVAKGGTNEQIRIYKRMLENPIHTFKYAVELKKGDIIKSDTELFIIHEIEELPKIVRFYGYRFNGKKLEYGTMRKHKFTIVCCEYKRK